MIIPPEDIQTQMLYYCMMNNLSDTNPHLYTHPIDISMEYIILLSMPSRIRQAIHPQKKKRKEKKKSQSNERQVIKVHCNINMGKILWNNCQGEEKVFNFYFN